MRVIILITVLLPAVFASSIAAADKTLRIEGDLCTYTLRYNPARYSEQEIQSTFNLLEFESPSHSVFAPFPNRRSTADLLRETEAECSSARSRVSNTKWMSLPGMPDYIEAKLDAIADSCNMARVQIKGADDPTVLRNYIPALQACSRYIDALEGNTDLQAMWQRILKENCRQNASPSDCFKRHTAENQAGGRAAMEEYVRTFGWSNCAAPFMIGNAQTHRFDAMRAALANQFKRTLSVKMICDSD